MRRNQTLELSARPIRMDCRVKPGNDEMERRSRDASASEVSARPRTKKIRSPQQKRERSAKRRIQPDAALRRQVYAVCATHLQRGSAHFRSALAFRRSAEALARALTSRLSSRPCFLGRGSWRALPALPCPSPGTAPPASAVVPRGVMPEAARERSASFRARAPPLLRPSKCPRERRPQRAG
jgi:hypothetical protein